MSCTAAARTSPTLPARTLPSLTMAPPLTPTRSAAASRTRHHPTFSLLTFYRTTVNVTLTDTTIVVQLMSLTMPSISQSFDIRSVIDLKSPYSYVGFTSSSSSSAETELFTALSNWTYAYCTPILCIILLADTVKWVRTMPRRPLRPAPPLTTSPPTRPAQSSCTPTTNSATSWYKNHSF